MYSKTRISQSRKDQRIYESDKQYIPRCQNSCKIQWQNRGNRGKNVNINTYTNSRTVPSKYGTTIKRGGIKLVIWAQAFTLNEMMWSCKCFFRTWVKCRPSHITKWTSTNGKSKLIIEESRQRFIRVPDNVCPHGFWKHIKPRKSSVDSKLVSCTQYHW